MWETGIYFALRGDLQNNSVNCIKQNYKNSNCIIIIRHFSKIR